mgnify:CR=1 FL=1
MSDDSMALGYALGQDSNGSNNGSGMWGGDGSWIFAFLIIALIFGGNGWGWGNNGGNGANGAGYQGAVTRSDLCSEFNFNNLSRSVLGIQDGLCNGFYSMNNGMLTGFNTLGSAVSNGFHGVDNAICQLGYQNAQLINGVNQNMNTGFNGVTAGLTALGTQMANAAAILSDRWSVVSAIPTTMPLPTHATLSSPPTTIPTVSLRGLTRWKLHVRQRRLRRSRRRTRL